jgi:hypothetical protein
VEAFLRYRFRFFVSNERIKATIEDEPEDFGLMMIRANLWQHWSSVEDYAACDRLLHDL